MDAKPPYRAVVIDDNQDSAESLSLLLRELGLDVYAAFDGQSAGNLILGCRPHVVFLDLAMPMMSGFDVLRLIRQNRELKATRVFAVTGLTGPSDIQASISAGFDGFIRKPASLEAYAEAIASLERTGSPIVAM